MGPNPPRAKFGKFSFGPLGTGRIVLQYVLLQMVKIGLTEHGKEIANARPMSHARMRRVETNLKVDQVRKAIVADDDVFSLVEIDVGQASVVHQSQRSLEPREERGTRATLRLPAAPRRHQTPQTWRVSALQEEAS